MSRYTGPAPSPASRATRLLFATRFIRLFACSALSVVLVFDLGDVGLSESRVGLLLTATLIGDTVISLYLTTRADRIGRRRMLVAGAALMAGAGLLFAFTQTRVFAWYTLAEPWRPGPPLVSRRSPA